MPLSDLVTPNKTHDFLSYEGWAYCARTPDKNIFLAYFEKGCPKSEIRGARPNSLYNAQWFNPRNGTWMNVGDGTVKSGNIGLIRLPGFPEDVDWGLKLIYKEPYDGDRILPTRIVTSESVLKQNLKKVLLYVLVIVFIFLLGLRIITRFRKW